jgi:hypothetical protein
LPLEIKGACDTDAMRPECENQKKRGRGRVADPSGMFDEESLLFLGVNAGIEVLANVHVPKTVIEIMIDAE